MKRTSITDTKDQHFDMIVIGGGLTGASVARDASLRGFRTILIEKSDFGCGTASQGPRLLVGEWAFPLRSEEKPPRQFFQEFELASQQAPHLIRPISSLFLTNSSPGSPSYPLHEEEKGPFSWLRSKKPSPKCIPLKKLQNTFDYLAEENVWGGYQSSDHLISCTERLCLENIHSAVQNGAVAYNYLKVTGINVHNRQVYGVQAEDQISGKLIHVQGDCIINATGALSGQFNESSGIPSEDGFRVYEELYLAIPQLDNRVGLALLTAVPSQEGNRYIQLAPWHEQLMFGPSPARPLENPDSAGDYTVQAAELFHELQRLIHPQVLAGTPLFGIRSRYAVPLGENKTFSTRPYRYWVIDHHRNSGPRGLITVLNPRAPLSRLAAKEAVDVSHSYTPSAKARHECVTQDQPLFGGNITNMEEYIQEVSNAARQFQLQDRQVRHLVYLYGTKAQELFPLLRNHPVLREQICRHQPDLKAQLVYAMEQESAISLSDIFLRRTAIGWTRCHGRDCAAAAAAFLGEHLGWTSARMEAELENFFQESEEACRMVCTPAKTSVSSDQETDDRDETGTEPESDPQ